MTSGRSVLLLEPTFGCDGNDACLNLLTTGEETAALSVLYREPVAERMALVDDHSDELESAAIVCVGPGSADESTADDCDAVRTISDPADLTGLGIAVTDWLAARSDGTTATVCLDSVSTLLQYADHDRALKFLHTMASRFRRTGVEMHCHVDPRAHGEQTLAQLGQLFDEQRRLEETQPAANSTEATSQRVATDGGTERGGEPVDDARESLDGR